MRFEGASQVMREERSFAYSLAQMEDGWRWSVYDENGVVVADGAHQTRDAAEAAVELTLKWPPPPSHA